MAGFFSRGGGFFRRATTANGDSVAPHVLRAVALRGNCCYRESYKSFFSWSPGEPRRELLSGYGLLLCVGGLSARFLVWFLSHHRHIEISAVSLSPQAGCHSARECSRWGTHARSRLLAESTPSNRIVRVRFRQDLFEEGAGFVSESPGRKKRVC